MKCHLKHIHTVKITQASCNQITEIFTGQKMNGKKNKSSIYADFSFQEKMCVTFLLLNKQA